jgi:hypothetical protein
VVYRDGATSRGAGRINARRVSEKRRKTMKTIILSALFAAGLGLAGVGGAVAAPVSNGISNATPAASLIEQVQYRRCRSVTVCRRGEFGRRHCRTERVCR